MPATGVVSLPVLSEIAKLRTRYDFAAGDRALRAGRRESAAAAFAHAAQTSPDPDRRYEAHRLAAEVFSSLERPVEQLTHLQALVALRPQETTAWRALASALQAQAHDGALDAWNSLLAVDGADAEAHEALLGLHGARDDAAAAAVHARVLADAAPRNVVARSRLGRLLDQARDSAGAIEAWSAVAALDPADLTAHARLADLFTAAGRRQDALVHLGAVAEITNTARAWTSLALARRVAGDAEGVEAAWRRLLVLPPGEATAHAELASLLFDQGRHAEAVPHLRYTAQREFARLKSWKRLAQSSKAAGDADGSVEAWRRVLEIGGAASEAHGALAGLLHGLGRANEAVPHVLALAQEQPDQPKPWIRLSQLQQELGDGDATVEALRMAAAAAPADRSTHESLATLLTELGRRGEALVHVRRIAELAPSESKPWRRLALASRKEKDFDGALAAWRHMLSIPAVEAEAREALVELLLTLGRAGEAAQHLRHIAEQQPQAPEGWRRLAETLKTTKDHDGVAGALRRLLAIPGAEAEADAELGALYYDLRRHAEAVPHLRATAEREKDRVKTWTRLARSAQKAGDAPQAIQAWGHVVDLEPGDRAARDTLIALLVSEGREAETVPHSRAIAEANPQDLKAWRRLAIAARAAQERELSVEAWRHVLQIGGADGEAHGHLGDMLFEMRRPAEAATHLKVMALAHPERLKPWRRLADTLQGLEDFPGAAEALEAILKVEDDTAVRERLVDVLLKAERPKEAAEQLRLLAQAAPKDALRWEQLARALAAVKDTAGAVAAWRKVVALDRQNKSAHVELAQLLNDSGQHAAAAPFLRWLAKRAPDDLKIQRRLGRALQVIGDTSAAMDTWKEVLRLEPEDTEASLALIGILQGLGRDREAVHYQRSAAYASGDRKTIRRFARSAQDLGDLDEARAAWIRILSFAPGDTEAHQQLASLAKTAGDETEALFHLTWVAQNKGTDERLWKRVAKAASRLGRTDEAAAAWERAFEIAPNDLDLHNTLADLFEQADDFAKAEPHLRWLIENGDGDRRTAWARLARNLARLGDAPGEIAAWREILTFSADDADAHNRLAALYKQQGDFATAAGFLLGLAEQEPTTVKPWKRLANLYAEAGDAQAEVDTWRTVLDINPDDGEGQARLAELLTELYLPAQALPHLQAIAERSADVAKHWQRVARAVQKSQGPQEALAAWERVLDLRPDDLEAHENMVRLLDQLGRAAEATPHLRLLADAGPRRLELWRRLAPQGRDVEAEIAWWKRVLALTPDDRTLLERLSLFLYGLGRNAEALPYFRELARLAPEDAIVWRRLARCLEETGDQAGAREAWSMVSMVTGDDSETQGGAPTVRAARARSSRPAAASGPA